MHKMIILIGILIFITIIMICGKFKENYTPFENVQAMNYYSPRTYAHNEYDMKRKQIYPYDYKPYEYYQRFNCYYPYDLTYGYGNW